MFMVIKAKKIISPLMKRHMMYIHSLLDCFMFISLLSFTYGKLAVFFNLYCKKTI